MQLTWDLGMDHVRSWVLGGDYELDDSFDRPLDWSSTIVTGLSGAAPISRADDASEHPRAAETDVAMTTAPTTPVSCLSTPLPADTTDKLRGVADDVDDALIPKQSEIRRVYNDGRHTWQHFLRQARSLPRGHFPPGLDPAVMLQDMPGLPGSIPKNGVLAGAPTWQVPDPETAEPQTDGSSAPDGAALDADLNLDSVTGTTKYFRLSYPEPLRCRITSDPSAAVYGKPPSPSSTSKAGGASNAAPQGLAILAMCWSYIISTQLLQLQGRESHFIDSCLRPIPINAVGNLADDDILVHLPSNASLRLVHWLCAVLAPAPGWTADDEGGAYSPWAACCTGNARFVVATDNACPDVDTTAAPPTPAEAVDLLIELCQLFGIDTGSGHGPLEAHGSAPLSPVKAAFLATLAMPFYRMAKLQPHFPRPCLRPARTSTALDDGQIASIRRYATDARYYMSLSMHPWSLGPVLWSIFWQPNIQCNLVSPWLAAVKNVIRPALDACDSELLAKVFTLRRPRVALWWHGLFLLGNPKIFDYIRSYLDTLDEGCSYDTLARPDIVSATWTGAAQSYQDDPFPRVYQHLDDSVPRADLLQHRHTLTLRDPWPLFYGWRPFGSVPKEAIEPDLYPWLETGHRRRYQLWTWWARDDKDMMPVQSPGYRCETDRFVPTVPDNLALLPAPDSSAPLPADVVNSVPLAPSKLATLQMMAHSLGNIVGERSISTVVFPGLSKSHPWIKDWDFA